jgi:hypothetical protein
MGQLVPLRRGEAMLEGLMKAARHAGGNAEKKVKVPRP